MTTRDERTRAVQLMGTQVVRMHKYAIRRGEFVRVPRQEIVDLVQTLRHYPLQYELIESHLAVPHIWGEPK